MNDPVAFERHGGFGGVVLRSTFTPAELTEPEMQAIAEVRRRQPFGRRHPEAAGPDRFEYHFDLPDGRVVISEEALPDSLRPLVTRLLERARRPS